MGTALSVSVDKGATPQYCNRSLVAMLLGHDVQTSDCGPALVELRIAMDYVLLSDDKGAGGEKGASSGEREGVAARRDTLAALGTLPQPPGRLRLSVKRAARREPQ